MSSIAIGFIGFGEVGPVLSAALAEGGAAVRVYDILVDRGQADVLRSRRRAEGIEIISLPELLRESRYILSTVTTQVAEQVARTCAPQLRPGQIYIDLNSTSPKVKQRLQEIIAPSGADFVEGAILGAIGATGAATRILLTGEKAAEASAILNELGLNTCPYGARIGKASLFKMLRSVFMKGIEALILECLVAGRRAGIAEDLFADIGDFMNERPFEQLVNNWLCSHAVAHERRYHEMLQVVETMAELGVEPVMTAGTVAFFRRSGELGFEEAFPRRPDSMDEVVAFVEERLRAQGEV
ncbi:MAG: NAD(P)-dependent oxidoreductase [Chloroflexi bacterium]|nr:NAD(P)-dependent oxidoreductase [Chloroflexota bacterium]